MRGAKMLGQSRVALEDYPHPEPPDGGVLIRIGASALCGSELHGYRAEHGQPFNGGHEAMGVVVEARNTKRIKPGDRVGIHAVWGCGRCAWCAEGRYTFCRELRGTPGTHAEYLAAPEHVLCPLDDDIPDEVGVLLSGDGLGVPFHANTRLKTRPGQFVCVFGAGPVGLGNVLVQSHAGGRVIAVDVNDYRLGLARELGAEFTINSRETDLTAAIRELTSGAGANKAIECAGRPETLRLALDVVGKAADVMAVGEQGDVPVHVSNDLIRRDTTLMGGWFYHYCEFPEMVALFRAGLAVDRLITHRWPLAEADTAFAEFAAGRTGKAILLP